MESLENRTPNSASDLDSLAKQIIAAHGAVQSALLTSVRRAVEAGRLLAQAKGQVPHGQWETWVSETTAISPRTARGYMQAAQCWEKADQAKRRALADLGLQKLLAEIAEPQNIHFPTSVTEVGEATMNISLPIEEEVKVAGTICLPIEEERRPASRTLIYIREQPDRKTQISKGSVLGPLKADRNLLAALRLIGDAHPHVVARVSKLDETISLENLAARLSDAAHRARD